MRQCIEVYAVIGQLFWPVLRTNDPEQAYLIGQLWGQRVVYVFETLPEAEGDAESEKPEGTDALPEVRSATHSG